MQVKRTEAGQFLRPFRALPGARYGVDEAIEWVAGALFR
jgi:hypothetical protein